MFMLGMFVRDRDYPVEKKYISRFWRGWFNVELLILISLLMELIEP